MTVRLLHVECCLMSDVRLQIAGYSRGLYLPSSYNVFQAFVVLLACF